MKVLLQIYFSQNIYTFSGNSSFGGGVWLIVANSQGADGYGTFRLSQ